MSTTPTYKFSQVPEYKYNTWFRHALMPSVGHTALRISDVDAHFQLYRINGDTSHQHFMGVEVKCRSQRPDRASAEHLAFMKALYDPSRGPVQFLSPATGQWVACSSHGFHLLQLSDETPDDSPIIWWNHKVVSREHLISILNFQSSPYF